MANEEHVARLKQEFVNVLARARHAPSGAAYVYVWGRTWIAERQVRESIRHISQRVMARRCAIPWQTLARQYRPLLVVFYMLLLLASLFAIWKIPQWYAASWERLTDAKDIAKLESDTRTIMVQAFGGLLLLGGLFFTAKTLRTTQEGQITDRFTKAINQLGEAGLERLAIRLGGIYALERIARDSERDHWTIMEILTAYVRVHAPWEYSQPLPRDQSPPKIAADIQAILTVLGRRLFGRERDHELLDLHLTNLRDAYLVNAHLEHAIFQFAYLSGATLSKAHLEDADLLGADLNGTSLKEARLERADLSGAHLDGADVTHAHLQGASLQGASLKKRVDFTGANLTGTHLEATDLRAVVGLTSEQIASAIIDEYTQLPGL